MADVAAVDIRKVQNKLLEWEQPDRPLAPLSTSQRNAVLDLSQEVNIRQIPCNVSEIEWAVRILVFKNNLSDVVYVTTIFTLKYS